MGSQDHVTSSSGCEELKVRTGARREGTYNLKLFLPRDRVI